MVETGKDFYQVLGVDKDADDAAIKAAYRALARRYHPDKNQGDAEAERRFKEITEAYAVLSNPEKRGQYDALRSGGFRFGEGGAGFEDLFGGAGGNGPGMGGGFGDLFSSLFGGRMRQGGGPDGRPRGPSRGEDIHHVLEVPFELAAKGGATHLKVPRNTGCGGCGGSGAATPADIHTCPDCHGSGQSSIAQGAFSIQRPCTRCLGRGKLIGASCETCGGSGQVREVRRISAKIPAGIEDGAQIRLTGEGRGSTDGGPPGNLVLEIRVQPDPELRREGPHVVSTLVVRLTEALLGTRREIRTLRGTATLTIPPGTAPGARLRLAGCGVERAGQRGDHRVEIRVALPRELTDEQRELVEQLARSGL